MARNTLSIRALCAIAVLVGASFALPVAAQSEDAVRRVVDAREQVALQDHHPAWASATNDQGVLADAAPMPRLTLQLQRSVKQQAAFDTLLREQQDPGSANYHAWLTPVEVGERYGASTQDLQTISAWLAAQGLHVEDVANNRTAIAFSGSAANVASAFGTELHRYLVNGESRVANTHAPKIPAALGDVVRSVRGLRSSKARSLQRPSVHQTASLMPSSAHPALTNCDSSGCSYFVFPADFATIYGITPLTQQNITGTGQGIVIVGRAQISNADVEAFENILGLPKKDPTLIVPSTGAAPPAPKTSCTNTADCSKADDQSEATLDVERATSVAPGADIYLVASADVGNNDGVFISTEYAIDHSPLIGKVLSISFDTCEGDNGREGDTYFDTMFQAAASEGISVLVASGDNGAADCDDDDTTPTPPATQYLSVNAVCASSYATCVGGTEFADNANPALYWSSNNSSDYGSALGYIPEGAWNEPLSETSTAQTAGSGGGVSSYIATPYWQVGTGVPGTQGRYVPDVALSASGHDPYFTCLAEGDGSCVVDNSGNFSFLGTAGTSASAPGMAGIVALLNQKMGAAQGNLNPELYALAATPAKAVFHDVTVASSGVAVCNVNVPSMCNNSTSGPTPGSIGQPGYLVGTGYDEVTGLGSIDAANLLANWGVAAAPVHLFVQRRCRIAPLHC